MMMMMLLLLLVHSAMRNTRRSVHATRNITLDRCSPDTVLERESHLTHRSLRFTTEFRETARARHPFYLLLLL
uniref:Putative secreted protein n=1 Tax=Anopheles triannulatus TaxID=58253 RepID=A0A2M4B2T2_9DIPT